MIFVRDMQESDIDAVSEINEEAFGKDAKADLKKILGLPQYHCYVAESSCSVCGFFELTVAADEAEIVFIATKNNYKRQGVANLLMSKLIEVAKENGAKKIFLEVEISNLPAISLYTKFGFKETYRRKDYYGKNKDAIILSKSLEF